MNCPVVAAAAIEITPRRSHSTVTAKLEPMRSAVSEAGRAERSHSSAIETASSSVNARPSARPRSNSGPASSRIRRSALLAANAVRPPPSRGQAGGRGVAAVNSDLSSAGGARGFALRSRVYRQLFIPTQLDEVRRLESELAAALEQGADGREKERLISEALVAATRAADELREEGKREGEAAVVEARTRAQEVLVVAEAEAKEQAQTLVEEAKADAKRFEDEAARLETEAERLRALSDQVSADLRSLLVGLLEKLETRGDRSAQQYEETAPPMPLDELQARLADRPDEDVR